MLPCLMVEGRPDRLLVPSGYPLAGWGLGYHQGARVLVQKQPLSGDSVDFVAQAEGVYASDLVCHVHRPPEGRWTFENAQPFGHQGWLCAHHGYVPGHDELREMRLAMLEDVVPFLRRNIQGCSDTEVLFHLYLSELHHHYRLPGVRILPAHAAETLVATVSRIEALVLRYSGRSALDELNLTMVLTNGESMVASAIGIPLHYRKVGACKPCPVCSVPPGDRDRPPREVGHEGLKATWLTSGLGLDEQPVPEGWVQVPDRSVIWISRAGELQVLPLPAPAGSEG